jgi:hypothetical protein
MKIAVVTPYCDEPVATLEACHESVRRQGYPCQHIMVADGTGHDLIERWNASHVRLGKRHRDGGCTPRSIGSLIAFARDFDGVAFLDADNRFLPNHIETLVEALEKADADIAFSDRRIVLQDGTLCNFEDLDVLQRMHADTSCHLFTKRSAVLASAWAEMGQDLWPLCDRIIFSICRRLQMKIAWSGLQTLLYTSHWGLHYKAMGLDPPRNEHHIDWQELRQVVTRSKSESFWITSEDIDFAFGNVHANQNPDESEIWSRIGPSGAA